MDFFFYYFYELVVYGIIFVSGEALSFVSLVSDYSVIVVPVRRTDRVPSPVESFRLVDELVGGWVGAIHKLRHVVEEGGRYPCWRNVYRDDGTGGEETDVVWRTYAV